MERKVLARRRLILEKEGGGGRLVSASRAGFLTFGSQKRGKGKGKGPTPGFPSVKDGHVSR